ncbi:MAG: DUF2779 domain-containing protein [Dehalococcoidales bacterium]
MNLSIKTSPEFIEEFKLMAFLSKSKYLIGLQCPKLLWHHYNAKDKLPPTDTETQALFEQGHEVEKLAQALFPGGITIGEEADFRKVVDLALPLLEKRKPLFEAGFISNDICARVDILVPSGDGEWDIVEVKSSTSIKGINYYDVAFQRHCLEGAGIKISRCYLMYINNQYVRKGSIDSRQLFIKEDITKEIEEYAAGIEEGLNKMRETIASKECPDLKIGPNCLDPYECVLKPACWGFLPEDNVLTFYRLNKKEAFKLIDKGVFDIKDAPAGMALTGCQSIQRECVKSGKLHINKAEIADFLSQLEFPLYFLDFETFGLAIPPYDNSIPYRQVPFQFSIHLWETPDSKPVHHTYLADARKDPRPEILSRLKGLLGKKGSIIAYNMSFEISRLKECAEAFPEYRGWVNEITPRFMDLLVPFRGFHYYHPSQRGSASIKRIAPPLTDKSYEKMEIGEGGLASAEYVRVTFGDVLGSDRRRVYEALQKYCEFDTLVMVDIIKGLRKLIA